MLACSPGNLGYKYQAGNFEDVHRSVIATLSSVLIHKRRSSDTALRLVFETTISLHSIAPPAEDNLPAHYDPETSESEGESAAIRLYFQIDGEDCMKPSKVEYSLLRSSLAEHDAEVHMPVVIRGVCAETRRGAIGKGVHRVTVNVDSVPGFYHPDLDVEIGWSSAEFTEVTEVCKGAN